jgi:hypothetical protein
MTAPIRFPFVANGKIDWPAALGFTIAVGLVTLAIIPVVKKAVKKVGG